MIELKHVDAGYGGEAVVQDISVRFEPGCVTSILGKNGCGKSTLLKTAARQQKPLAGQILLDGRDIFTIPPKEFARMAAVLPQARVLQHFLSAQRMLRALYPAAAIDSACRPYSFLRGFLQECGVRAVFSFYYRPYALLLDHRKVSMTTAV